MPLSFSFLDPQFTDVATLNRPSVILKLSRKEWQRSFQLTRTLARTPPDGRYWKECCQETIGSVLSSVTNLRIIKDFKVDLNRIDLNK